MKDFLLSPYGSCLFRIRLKRWFLGYHNKPSYRIPINGGFVNIYIKKHKYHEKRSTYSPNVY
jgi:hypothetical protein